MAEWMSQMFRSSLQYLRSPVLSIPIHGLNTGILHTSFCDRKVMDRLACDLSDTLTSDQCKASTFICKMFRDLHHVSSHNDR